VPDYANVLLKVVAIFVVINRVPATTPAHKVFHYSTVTLISTPSVNSAFRHKSGFKNKCRARSGFGLAISGPGRVQASKWGLFATLCGYACRGQQGEIERIPPPPTNSKNRLKSFCEVGSANFRRNVFAAGERISMEILVGVVLHAWCPVALKRLFQKTEMCKKNVYRLCNFKRTRHQIAL